MARLLKSLLFSLGALAFVSAYANQEATAPEITVKFDKPKATVGYVVGGTVTINFGDGLHAYQNPPSDQFEIPIKLSVVEQGFKLIKISYPKGTDFTMAGESKPTKVYQGTIRFPIQVAVSKRANNYNVNFRLDYQQCNASSCFPPASVITKAKLLVQWAARKK